MGERLSGGGTSGRRAHPGAVSGPRHAEGDAGLEALIAAALRQDLIDAEAEQRAVAAFCAARDAGAHRARSRRRDDWRPSGGRTRLSVRATLSVLAASLTLGGVAYATIGSGGFPDGTPDGRTGRPQPGTSAPDRAPERTAADPSASASTGPSPSTGADRPATAEDAEAHCSAYEEVRAQGRALDATAWRRLVTEAGGEDEVEDFCARTRAAATAKPSAVADPPAAAASSAAADPSAAADRPTDNGNPTRAATAVPGAETGTGKDNGRGPTAAPTGEGGRSKP